MALAETLITGLGAAVAKGILAMWLKDDPLALVASTETTGLIKTKLDDVFQQNALKREIDSVADRSAKAFSALIQKEGAAFNESELEAVANAAATVISETDLTPELVLQNNLDPAVLAEFYVNQPGREGGNPGIAKDPKKAVLYKNLLVSAAEQIIDISSRLPRFEQRKISTILTTLNEISEASQLHLEKLYAAEQGLDLASERYETNFRLACEKKFDRLQLFGVDLDASNKRYKLSVAYVTLEVESKSPSQEADSEPVSDVIGNSKRLLIRGPAGAGKTTLIQWMAVHCAAKIHTGKLEACNSLVPFVIKFRDLESLPNADQFAAITSPYTAACPDGWAHKKLIEGKAVVLLDGLDEADESQREEVANWLASLISQYPNARYIVTTRPHAVEEGWLDSEEFLDASLLPMTQSDIISFVGHWHDSISSEAEEAEKKKISELAAALKSELTANRDLSKLSSSPLLCAMICALHRDRSQALPTNRIDLYKACIDMFLRRDTERKIGIKDYVQLDDLYKRLLLRSLAWWMIRNEKSAASLGEVESHFASSANQMKRVPPEISGKAIAKLFIERVSLLQQYATGKVNFPHRTFQEFLGAQEAVAQNDFDLLVNQAENEKWREVAILAAGLIENPEQAADYVGKIFLRADSELEFKSTLYLTGAAAFQNLPRLPVDSALESQVKDKLESVIPPRSIREAEELATAGNLVVPLLKHSKKIKAIPSAAAVRTLALIGTKEALDVLKGYTKDSRATVASQIAKSFKYISVDNDSDWLSAYELKRLNLDRNQTAVDLRDLRFNKDCSLLRGFSNMSELSLYRCISMSDLSDLRFCSSLESLAIGACDSLTDLSDIGSAKVATLSITSCERLSNISALAQWRELQEVEIAYCAALADLTALAKCVRLEVLEIRGLPHRAVQSLSQTRDSFNQLRKLTLWSHRDAYYEEAFDFIDGAKNIESIDFYGDISSRHLEIFSSLPSLKSLSLDSPNGFEGVDLSILAKSESLESLSLETFESGFMLASITGCLGLKSIEIYTHFDDGLDLTPLKELPMLQSVTGFGTNNLSKRSLAVIDELLAKGVLING